MNSPTQHGLPNNGIPALADIHGHEDPLYVAGRKQTLEPLAVPFTHPDAPGTHTIGEYLAELLNLLLEEGEGFDPKRPFGNSGWQDDIEETLTQAGFEKPWPELFRAVEAGLESAK